MTTGPVGLAFYRGGPILFFLASKTIGVLLVPSNVIIAIGALGLLLSWSRYQRLGRTLLAGAMAALLICGYLPIGKLLLLPLETRFVAWSAAEGEPAGIIVLGGGIEPMMSAAHGSPALSPEGVRIVVAAALAR